MLWSHPHTDLKEHLEKVGKNSRVAVSKKSLNLTLCNSEELEIISYLIGIGHDFGKATTGFQEKIQRDTDRNQISHAPLSSVFTYYLIYKYISGNSIIPEISYLAVRYHHGNLKSPYKKLQDNVQNQWENIKTNNKDELQDIYKNLLKNISFSADKVFHEFDKFCENNFDDFSRKVDKKMFKFRKKCKREKLIETFLLTNFLFSVLVDSDKKVAAELETREFGEALKPVLDVNGYLKYCRENDPDNFSLDKSINKNRNQFFKEVTENEKIQEKNHLYTITAPTGIGKTLTAYGVTTQLKKVLSDSRRVIYALPFTSIIDQNFEVLRDIMEWQDEFYAGDSKYLLKHHYLSTMAGDSEEYLGNPARYLRNKMTNETWESGYIVTTFVQLFHSIIGHQNSFLKKFHNITNSIIILDEVQNIPAKYLGLVRQIFRVFAHKFDTYFILMTATQPEIFKPDESEELAPGKYFNCPDFDRVNIKKINKLEPMSLEKVLNYFSDKPHSDNILFVFNTKRSAIKSYKYLAEKPPFHSWEKFCLTTYLTPADREKQIEKIQEFLQQDKQVLAITTQLIEAGVDVSFEEVWRDIGPFDSILQVAGRCNRNGEMNECGKVKVVSIQDKGRGLADKIYGPQMIQSTRNVLKSKSKIVASDFLKLSEKYFTSFNYEKESRQLLNGISALNYSQDKKQSSDEIPVKDFELIEEFPQQKDLVICTKQEVEKKLQELDNIYNKIAEKEQFTDNWKELMGRAILIKKELAEFTITVYSWELDIYKKSDELRTTANKSFLYVPFENVKHAYNSEFGFIYNPEIRDLTTTKVI